jgi:hypothetical protein
MVGRRAGQVIPNFDINKKDITQDTRYHLARKAVVRHGIVIVGRDVLVD